MSAPPRIDAINCPSDYPAALDFVGQRLARNAEFGKILGVQRVHSRHVPGNRDLVTREAAGVTERNPAGHPAEGRPRYDWEDRGDGVLYGFLTEAATSSPAPAGPDGAAAASIEARRRSMAARLAALQAVAPGARTADQAAELARLAGRYQAMHPDSPLPTPNSAG